ncbi:MULTISPECIES: Bug family tripartite tricarboxylate transporter substrate binding protein [Ramlibacter]|uniref:Tripartite tricarboxylate transporter substrate binding protein n=1 Tax=Ramlibacter pinisoli TaxID=2682844 RepID=A0A6N8IPF8_9BURK|nr:MULTISPECIES: tripartite tricarboxylate transporter substrate-binding protein [Ramlibacter]MBA2963795.1 tripartite tricarboxylate transporter substrate binding protein [Ramlibacter sp. CGMCC 1.13660]MVQ28761.1 tripartite tricarboxylate transporter substrate binding protein [Ramlibacter pinisoli]
MARPLHRLLAALAAFALSAAAAADTYPAKPVHLVVHNNPGSALDLIARQVAQRLSDGWKQPVVIDNRPGGGGIVGTDLVAKSAADGHTLLAAGDGPITILPALSASLPYNPARDLLPIASLGELDFVLVANPRTGLRSVRDLVEAARRQPGRYTFASSGNGSPQHFAAELLKQNAGIHLTHIPYGGGPAGLAGVLAGDVDLMFIAIAPALQQIQSGRLVALAVAGDAPHPLLPGVPTVGQTYKDFKAGAWLVLFAPAATPAAVADRLAADASRVLADPSLRSQLAAQGVTVTGHTGARLRDQLAGEARRYQSLVRSAGIRAD